MLLQTNLSLLKLNRPTLKPLQVKDWRPDSHIVKKGDTLFGVGLEYGIDYKEIAAANNIIAPYPIKIGQIIDLRSFKTKTAVPTETTKAEAEKAEDGVVVTPIKIEPAVTGDKTVVDGKACSIGSYTSAERAKGDT